MLVNALGPACVTALCQFRTERVTDELTGDVDNIMGYCTEPDHLAPNCYWHDLRAVKPGDAIDQGICSTASECITAEIVGLERLQ